MKRVFAMFQYPHLVPHLEILQTDIAHRLSFAQSIDILLRFQRMAFARSVDEFGRCSPPPSQRIGVFVREESSEQFVERSAICIPRRCGVPPTHGIRRHDHSQRVLIGAIHSIPGDELPSSSDSLHSSSRVACRCYGGTCIIGIGIFGVAEVHRPSSSAGITSHRHGRSSPRCGRVARRRHREKWTPAGIIIIVVVFVVVVVCSSIAATVIELRLSIASSSSSSSSLQMLHSRERGRRSSRHRRADGTCDEGSEDAPAGDSDGAADGFGGERIYFRNVHVHSPVVVAIAAVIVGVVRWSVILMEACIARIGSDGIVKSAAGTCPVILWW
mmetsp:Transcript_31622/g.57900  ORF Transcript_31622/g.57900 Transcript_31622/m.57900 type:complete len:329 (+) Transcript_31622:257-1243(+)